MTLDALEQFLSIAASIVTILAFFGVARVIDRRQRPGEPPKDNQWVASGAPVASVDVHTAPFRLSLLGALIGGCAGGLVTGTVFNAALQSVFFPMLPVTFVIWGAIITCILWTINAPIGARVKDATSAVITSGIVSGPIGVLLLMLTSPSAGVSDMIFSATNAIIVGAVASLVGHATSVRDALLIGALGGAITGLMYGLFVGFAGALVGVFVGIVAAGVGGALTMMLGRRF